MWSAPPLRSAVATSSVWGEKPTIYRVGQNRMWQAQATVFPVENDYEHTVYSKYGFGQPQPCSSSQNVS